MRIYPYRTTFDKMVDAHERVRESGDTVLSSHFMGGRDWVLICRQGEQTVCELTTGELIDAIGRGVVAGLESHGRRARR